VIDARDLSMRYGAVTALDAATFRAEKGEVVGLLGPNGAGKTTTMRILTTFQHPSEGTATVAGFDVIDDPLEVRRRIGYLPESLPLYLGMEVRECLNFVGRARGLRGRELKQRTEYVVDKCGLGRMFHTPVLELSKGYRQRTGLAQALVHAPDVVILDEPTSGLDPHQILEIRRLVRELADDHTVLLSTHILQEASATADRLLVLSRGRIVGEGTVAELRAAAGVHPRLTITVRGDGASGGMGAISMMPAAGAVTRLDDGVIPGVARFEAIERADSLSADVANWARDTDLLVTELAREPGTLEDVFLALTMHAEAAVGSEPPASPTPAPDPVDAGEEAAA